MIMLAVDKSMLNWKPFPFTYLHNMVITIVHPKKIIYAFTSVRDSQAHLTNIPGVLLLIWMHLNVLVWSLFELSFLI